MNVASQMAVAIERAELLDGLKQVSEKTLGGAQDIYENVVDTVHRLTRCPVAMWWVDTTGKQARIVASQGVRSEHVQHAVVDLEHSVTGRAIRERTIMQVLDIQADADFQNKGEAAKEGWQSMLAVPLSTGPSQAVGTLSIYSLVKKQFTPWETDLLRTFANFAGVAIQNTRFLQQERTLREVSSAISSNLELEQVAGRILDELRKVVEYRKASVQLIQGDNRTLIASRGFSEDHITGWLLRPISQDRLINRIVASKNPLILSHPSQDDDWENLSETAHVKSWVGLPLVYRGETIGLLTLDHDQPGYYTESIKDMLALLSNQAAIAISNAQSVEKAEKHHKTLERLLDTSREISELALQGPQGILEQIARSVCKEVGADCAVIYPYDPNRTGYFDASLVAYYGLEHYPILADKPREGGMAARIRQTQAGILEIPDISREDPAWNRPLMQREGIQAFVGVSLRTESEEVGVMYVNFRGPHRFSDDERKLIQQYAREALAAIVEGRQAAKVELSALLKRIAQSAKELLGADIVTLYQYRRGRDEEFVTPPAISGELRERPPMGRKIHEHDMPVLLVQEGKPYFADDVSQDEFMCKAISIARQHDPQPDTQRFIEREGIRSSAGVLLKAEGEIVGVMFVNYRTLHPFTEEVRQEIDLFASQAAIAIRSARIFEETRALREIGQMIASATLESELMLDLILEQTLNLVGFSKGWISLLDARTGTLEMRAAQGLHKSEWHPLKKGRGISWHVIETGEPVNVPDVSREELYEKFFDDTKSELCVPLKYKDKVLGVLNLESARPAAFTSRAEELVTALASEAAIAIQNANLLQAMQLLRKVSAQINTTLKLDETLNLIVKGAMELTGTSSGVIRLLDETRQSIVRSFEFPEGFEHLMPRLTEPNSMTRAIIDSGEPIPVPDITRDDRVNPALVEKGIKSLIGLPLKFEKEVIGVLFLNATELREFTDEEQSLLVTLADQAAIAIENAQLFKERQDRIDDLDALSSISHGLGSKELMTISAMSKLLYEESCKLMNLENFYVALYDEEGKRVTFEFVVEDGQVLETQTGEWAPRADGNGLTEYVIRESKAVYIPSDIRTWREEHQVRGGLRGGLSWEQQPETQAGIPQVQSWLGVPIKVGDEVLGVIGVQNYQRANAYDEYDSQVLSTIAAQLGIAIVRQDLGRRNAELDRRNKDIAVLTGIHEKIIERGSKSEDEILDLIYTEACEVMVLRDALFFIAFYDEKAEKQISFGLKVESENGTMIDRIRWGEAAERPGTDELFDTPEKELERWKPRSRRQGLTEYVIDNKQPLLIAENFEEKARKLGIQVWPTIGLRERPTHSWLGVPMIVAGRIRGMVAIQNLEKTGLDQGQHLKEKPGFDQNQLDLLATVANQAAVAIENARLLDRETKRAEQLAGLQEIGVKITSQLELREVLGSFLENVNDITFADFSTLLLYNSEQDRFESATRKGKVDVEPSIPSHTGFAASIAKSQKPVFAEDTDTQQGVNPIFVQEKKVKSFAGVPLLFSGRTVGILYVNFFEPRRFSEEEKEIIGLLANQAAVAIENARLYENLRVAYDELRRAREREIWAALGEVAAGLVHKMSNTIGPIPSLAERVKHAVGPIDPTTETKLHRISEGASDALSYTAGLAKILELRKVNKEPADIQALFDDALRQALPEPQGQKITVKTYYSQDLPTLYVNSPLIIEAFQNILRNAVEAMPSGGVLRVSLDKADGEGVRIEISDTGSGIPEDKKAKIFQVGFSSKKEGKGIGLWFSKTVIGQHQGSISFESREHVGTTFTITLPIGHATQGEELAGGEVPYV